MFGNMKVKAKQVLNESDVAEDDNALNKTTFGASKDNSFSATEDRQNKSFNAPQKKAAEKTTTDQGSNEAKKGNALNFMAQLKKEKPVAKQQANQPEVSPDPLKEETPQKKSQPAFAFLRPKEKNSKEEVGQSPKIPAGSVVGDNQTSFERGIIPKPGFGREESDNEDPYPDDTIQLEDDIIKEESGERDLENIIHNMSQEDAAEDQQDRSVEIQHSQNQEKGKKDDQEDIRDVVERRMNEVNAQIGQRSQLKQKIFLIFKEQNNRTRKIDDFEEETKALSLEKERIFERQNQAIEKEDYLIADQLENQIKDINSRVEYLEKEIIKKKQQIAADEIKTKQIYEEESGELEEFDQSLNEIDRELKLVKSNYYNTQSSKLKRERSNYEDQLKRKQESLNFVQVTMDNLKKERQGLEEGISKQTKDIQTTLDEFQTRDAELDEEIADLRQKLDARIKEQQRIKKEIKTAQTGIQEIRSNFEEEFDSITRKEETIMEELDDKQSELTKTELKLLKVKNQEDRMNGLLTEYQNKLDQIKELRTRIQRDMFKLSEQGNERDEIDHKLQKTKNVYLEKSQQVKMLRREISEKKQKVQELESHILQNDAQVRSVADSLPNLEAQKTTVARAKNFLEANKLSKEIKARQTQIEDLERENESLKEQIENLNGEIPSKEKKLVQLESALPEYKIQYDVSQYNKLKIRFQEFVEIARFCRLHELDDIDVHEIEREKCLDLQEAYPENIPKESLEEISDEEEKEDPDHETPEENLAVENKIDPEDSKELAKPQDENSADQASVLLSKSQDKKDSSNTMNVEANTSKNLNLDDQTTVETQYLDETTKSQQLPENVLEEPLNTSETPEAGTVVDSDSIIQQYRNLQEEYANIEATIEKEAEQENYEECEKLQQENDERKEQLEQLKSKIIQLRPELELNL